MQIKMRSGDVVFGTILLVITRSSSQSLNPIRTVLMKAVRIFFEPPNEIIAEPALERNAPSS